MWLKIQNVFGKPLIAALGSMMMIAGITACGDDQQQTPQMEEQQSQFEQDMQSPEDMEGMKQDQQPAPEPEGGDTGDY